jgi:hypothetical protein
VASQLSRKLQGFPRLEQRVPVENSTFQFALRVNHAAKLTCNTTTDKTARIRNFMS